MWNFLFESIWGFITFLGIGASALFGAYFRGWFEGYLPAYGRVARFIRYHWTRNFSHFPPQVNKDQFLIILCCLENDDVKETAQKAVARALDKVRGIGVIRDYRLLHVNGSNRADAQSKALQRARRILAEHGNPMSAIIWGEVVKRDESVRLCFLGADSHEFHDLTFDKGFISSRMHEALGTTIAAVCLAVVRPILTEEDRFVAHRLEPLVSRLRDLSTQHAAEFTNQTKWVTQNTLGEALHVIGYQLAQNESLKEAIATFRNALNYCPRDQAPLDWATTQTNLATSLARLGERIGDTNMLEEAISNFSLALESPSRELAPLNWARTQNRLGATLAIIKTGQADAANFRRVFAAFDSALEIRTRERFPLEWAATKHNLGAALWTLWEQWRNPDHLRDAIKNYQEALQETKRDRVPLSWATTKVNLGAALHALGALEGNPLLLEEAIASYRKALEEITQGRAPLLWANTQNNLGVALEVLGTLKSDATYVRAAITAYEEAQKEHKQECSPLYWARTKNNLGRALAALGKMEGSVTVLEKAVDAYRSALEERTRNRGPLDWATTEGSLANCLAAMADLGVSPDAHLTQAIMHMQNALDGFRQAGHSHHESIAEKRLAKLKARQQ
jgi:tetratricopeptide (TPR) repeat protein